VLGSTSERWLNRLRLILRRRGRRSPRQFLHLGRRQSRRPKLHRRRSSARRTEPAKISPLGLVCYCLLGELPTRRLIVLETCERCVRTRHDRNAGSHGSLQELSAINAKPTKAYDFIVASSFRTDRTDCKPRPNNPPARAWMLNPSVAVGLTLGSPGGAASQLRWSATLIVADHSRGLLHGARTQPRVFVVRDGA
jgi:hypothetical protein